MIWLYINSSNRTDDLKRDKLKITNQIQQRSDDLEFTLLSGTKPSENQPVRLFSGDTIASAAGATITLNGYYQHDVGRFYPGQSLYIRIGDADAEKVTIQSYTESTHTIILTAAPSGVVSAGDKIGALIFGGVVSRVTDRNIHVLTQLEYDIECVDYTKVFDKKLISDTWEGVDVRYIINDFVNTTINYNNTVDSMSYASNGDLQAEWIESGDGNNPTRDSADYLEGVASAILDWTFAGGTATFSGTPTSANVSQLTGAASGTPVSGKIMLWIKATDYTKITSIKVRIGSSSGNYAEMTMKAPIDNNWYYTSVDLDTASITGTPDWTAMDYAAIVITETASSSIRVNGLRINAEGSFTLYNVEPTPVVDDFRLQSQKPTRVMQLLAESYSYLWFIDYEYDIHFADIENEEAPFELTETSNNFYDLQFEVDQSQIGNRIEVQGGKKLSDSMYAQVFQGDNHKREWKLYSDFSYTGFTVLIDDNSDTHVSEAGTTTTNIKITGHNLVTGDHVVNRTVGVVRSITKVDNDNFTVETVVGQVAGDTISFFSTAKTIGIDGVDDETTKNYMGNQDDESVRSSSAEATLTTTDYVRFAYYERVPIQIRYSDAASVAAMKALGFGDGIFDLDPFTDRNIEDINTAILIAQAKVAEYSNAIITGSFTTDQDGLRAGQIIRITDSNRGIDSDFVIQKVKAIQSSGQYADYFEYDVTFGTTLFGIIEFYQKLLAMQSGIEQNADDIVVTYVDSYEDVESNDVNSIEKEGDENAKNTETVESNDVNQAVEWDSNNWKFETSVGQTLESRFDLASFA